MNINDPLGDMLTRIRNAQMRRKNKVSTPISKLRERVLDVLADEGYIRGYARVDYNGGKSEFEIELKYFDGEPVIKDIKRVFAVFESGKGARGTGLGLPVTQKILREHGGDIRVEKNPGDGVSFTITLPLQPDERVQNV